MNPKFKKTLLKLTHRRIIAGLTKGYHLRRDPMGAKYGFEDDAGQLVKVWGVIGYTYQSRVILDMVALGILDGHGKLVDERKFDADSALEQRELPNKTVWLLMRAGEVVGAYSTKPLADWFQAIDGQLELVEVPLDPRFKSLAPPGQHRWLVRFDQLEYGGVGRGEVSNVTRGRDDKALTKPDLVGCFVYAANSIADGAPRWSFSLGVSVHAKDEEDAKQQAKEAAAAWRTSGKGRRRYEYEFSVLRQADRTYLHPSIFVAACNSYRAMERLVADLQKDHPAESFFVSYLSQRKRSNE